MANEKRLIYAEDLFEPVDYKVLFMGGRSGGKTMAIYEKLFRKRVELAPTVDAAPVVHGWWMQGYPMSCSVCGGAAATAYEDVNRYEAWLSPYCPNCGADMRGVEDGQETQGSNL